LDQCQPRDQVRRFVPEDVIGLVRYLVCTPRNHGQVLPRRWVVERTLAWLNRNRRLAKDVERTIESAATWLYIASVKLMSRRLATA